VKPIDGMPPGKPMGRGEEPKPPPMGAEPGGYKPGVAEGPMG